MISNTTRVLSIHSSTSNNSSFEGTALRDLHNGDIHSFLLVIKHTKESQAPHSFVAFLGLTVTQQVGPVPAGSTRGPLTCGGREGTHENMRAFDKNLLHKNLSTNTPPGPASTIICFTRRTFRLPSLRSVTALGLTPTAPWSVLLKLT